jgi:protein gp37
VSDGTTIEWTDATWNVVNGCSVLSPGCTNCYAMKQAHRFPARQGLTHKTNGGMVWTGEVRFNAAVLLHPLRWKRPRKIFVCAHGDLFHEKVPDEWIDRVFAVMALARHHTFQVLTKRPERMRDYLKDACSWMRIGNLLEELKPSSLWNGNVYEAKRAINEGQLPNVWLGTSVEDQKRADERIPILLDTPAAVRWLSCEPLLGPVDLSEWLFCPTSLDHPPSMDPTTGVYECCAKCDYTGLAGFSGPPTLDWVVAGGESGPGARPMHPAWARGLRDQCAAAGVAFLFKQWGEWHPDCLCERPEPHRTIERPSPGNRGCMFKCGKHAGRLLDLVQHDGYPA